MPAGVFGWRFRRHSACLPDCLCFCCWVASQRAGFLHSAIRGNRRGSRFRFFPFHAHGKAPNFSGKHRRCPVPAVPPRRFHQTIDQPARGDARQPRADQRDALAAVEETIIAMPQGAENPLQAAFIITPACIHPDHPFKKFLQRISLLFDPETACDDAAARPPASRRS